MIFLLKTWPRKTGKKKSVVGYFIDQCIIFFASALFFSLYYCIGSAQADSQELLEPAFHWLNVIQQPARWHALEMKCGEDSEERIPFIVYK